MLRTKRKTGLRIIGKKGNSLRSVTLLILFVLLTFNIFFQWLGEGIPYYGKTISSDYSTNFGKINQSITTMEKHSRNFNKKIDSIKESPETTLFFIPGAILDAVKMTFEYVKIASDTITQYSTIIGLAAWITNVLIVALLFYLGYLILDAYLRNKRT